MADFVLTLTAPDDYDVETFDAGGDIWSETDNSKTTASRYTADAERPSVMQIQGDSWTLGDGITLGDDYYLGDSDDGAGEGVYADYTVVAESIYSFSCFYKCLYSGELTIQIYDQSNLETISEVYKTENRWVLREERITAPVGCTTIRIKFMQRSGTKRSGPFYLDNVALNENALTINPDPYSRETIPQGIVQKTLPGKRILDITCLHFLMSLNFDFMDAAQYALFYELMASGERLYFDDGDVPALREREQVYDAETDNYVGIANPSGTHIAYKDDDASMPSAEGDFETAEISDAEYLAIDGDDSNYLETSNPDADKYLYHKLTFLSGIAQADVSRFEVRIVVSGNDASPANIDGAVLYAWNQSTWVELARATSSAKQDITYSTAETEIAQTLIDGSDNYVRLLIQSRGRRSGANDLTLRTYFGEIEINVGLDLTIDLTHRAILDDDNDVIWVKNLTQTMTLKNLVEYEVATDKRSIALVYPDSIDFNAAYNAVAANNTIHDITTEDVGIHIWVKIDSDGSGVLDVVTKYASNAGYWLYIDANGLINLKIGDGTDTYLLTGTTDIRDNTWHPICGLVDKSAAANSKMYVDGAEDGTTVKTGDLSLVGSLTNSDTLVISDGNSLDGQGRDMVIAYPADIMAANEVGAGGEIAYMAANPMDKANYPNYEDYWAGDDGSGTTVTGDNNDLTLSSADAWALAFESGDNCEAKFNRHFEVAAMRIREVWLSGDPSEERKRQTILSLETLSETRLTG